MVQSKRVALVTGANRGLGLELSRQLAMAGLKVILTSRSDQGVAAAKDLRENHSLDVDHLFLDVSDLHSIKQAAEQVEEKYGRLDVLVNNAGVNFDGRVKKLIEQDPERIEQTLRVNFLGPLYLIQAFLPLMRKHNYGRIINVSSGYGSFRSLKEDGPGAYKLSKWALNGMTQILAAEVTGNIKINAVSPGWVRTDMGGPNAPISAEEAARSILWLALLDEDGPTGGFFHDRESIPW